MMRTLKKSPPTFTIQKKRAKPELHKACKTAQLIQNLS